MNSAFNSNPLPLPLLFLWLTIPGIWLGACALADLLVSDRAVARMLRPAVAISAWIVSVQVASMAVHSFWIGMPLGMIFLSVAGLALWWARRAASRQLLANDSESRFARGMWLGMIVSTIPIALLAFRGYFHDIDIHMFLGSQLQNDYFPPRVLGFSHVLLRYHYGFDLVSAGLTALTRLSVPTAIRIVTIFGWAYTWCLVWQLGQRITGRAQGGLWTAIATMLSGGLAIFIAPFLHDISWQRRLTGFNKLGTGTFLNPPFVSYIFQHPFSLGFPLGFAVLLAVASLPADRGSSRTLPDQSRERRYSTYLLIGLLLAALSMTQSIFFLALAATLAFTEIVVARQWLFGAILAGVFGIAWFMGGSLFTRVPDHLPSGLHFAFWPITVGGEHPGEPVWRWSLHVLAWHLATFGFLLPLGIWGFRRLRRLRLAAILLAAGGLALPLFVSFDYSMDMVKFSTIAAVALGLGAGAAVTYLASLRSLAGRLVLAAAVLLLTLSSLSWMSAVGWMVYSGHGPKTFTCQPVALGDDDQQCMSWLRVHAKADEMVYRLPAIALGYCQWGGLSATRIVDPNEAMFGVLPQRIAHRNEVIATLPSEFEQYRAIGIDWFVVGPDDPRMERNVRAWEQDGQVVKSAEFGDLRVFEIAKRPTSADLLRSSALNW